MDVTVFLEPKIDLEHLAAILDGLGHEGRVHTTRTWSAKQQEALFEAAKGFRPAKLDFLVPEGVPPLNEVVHQGINSMPAFRVFQKRFTNTAKDGAPQIFGFNRQVWEWFSGPGYFTAREGDGEHAGELVIDYQTLPSQKPASWPEIRRNDGGTAALVYGGGLVDYVRPISNHVSVATAFKGTRHQNWFVLVRQDPR
jgi:hypothetical protein